MVGWIRAARTPAQQRTLILRLRMERDPRTVAAVVRHLEDTPAVAERRLATRILGASGAGWVLDTLRRQRSHPDKAVKRAARAALAQLCPRARYRTRYALEFEPTQQKLPKALQAGRTFQLHLATVLPGPRNAIFRWPGCPRVKGRRATRYRIRPYLELSRKGEVKTLKVSVMLVRLPHKSVGGYARAQATFKQPLTPRMLHQLLAALTANLKRQIHRYLSGPR